MISETLVSLVSISKKRVGRAGRFAAKVWEHLRGNVDLILTDCKLSRQMCRRALSIAAVSLMMGVIACNLPVKGSPVIRSGTPFLTPTIRPFVTAKGLASDNWAGYIVMSNAFAPQSNVVTDVQGMWIVPAVSCTDLETASSIWIGIDGDVSKTVEQAGTEQDCVQGKPSYFAWYELYPKAARQSLTVSINAGDVIRAEIQYVSGDDFMLSLVNQTTGDSFNVVQTGRRARRQSAEWIVEAPFSGKILPLANFGLVTFLSATATLKGHSGPISDTVWHYSVTFMVKQNESPKAEVSTLTSDGRSFGILWKGN